MGPDFIITPRSLVQRDKITYVDVSRVEEALIVLHYEGLTEEVVGVQAIDILMQLRPSVLEGRRMRWAKRVWILHNMVAHPTMQVLALLKFYRAAMWVHDVTVPRPKVGA